MAIFCASCGKTIAPKGNTIAIKVRFPDFTTKTRQKRLSYQTDREDVLYDVATVLYNKLNVQGPFRLLGITVSGFHKSVEQESLFHSVEEEPDVLASTLDALEERFGEDVVTTGALWKRKQQMTEETPSDPTEQDS